MTKCVVETAPDIDSQWLVFFCPTLDLEGPVLDQPTPPMVDSGEVGGTENRERGRDVWGFLRSTLHRRPDLPRAG